MTNAEAKQFARDLYQRDELSIGAIRSVLLWRGVDVAEMTVRKWVTG